MASLNEIASYLGDRIGKPLDEFARQDLKFSIRYWRAFLIRQDVERNGTSREFLQRFTTKLKKVDKADTCVVDLDCVILRTVEKVPTPVRLKQPIPFKYVGEVGGTDSWTHTELEELPFTEHNKYTANIIRYTYINNYVYVYGNTRFKYVTIEGVFADPSAVIDLCADTTCFTDDDSFPIGDDMLKTLVGGILSGEFKVQTAVRQETPTVEINETE